MNVLDTARVLIYRIHEKGLEIFMIKPDLDQDPEAWKLPSAQFFQEKRGPKGPFIQLDNSPGDQDERFSMIATEGDWHDIPSIRGIIKHDLNRAKKKVEAILPDLTNGDFIAAQVARQRLSAIEQSALGELEEIVRERNLLFNI